MLANLLTRAALGFAAVLVFITNFSVPGRAADASAWVTQPHAAVRLIAGAQPEAGNTLRAGVEVKLDPGWKTYWRYPGDSGVPPRFVFARSDNVDAVAVSWPAPHGFADGNGTSIGYTGQVVFPLRITRKDPDKPVVIRLDLEFAICEKLCVPAEATAELALDGGGITHEAALAAGEARVPKPARLGEDGPLAIRSAVRRSNGTQPRVLVEVESPGDTRVELFAEGPTPDWALPVPERIAGAPPGAQLFAFDLDGLPPGAAADGATLTLTAVSPIAAIEVTTRLE
jgi:DsbC/DsbD-like thiol-disulfide interchange protein